MASDASELLAFALPCWQSEGSVAIADAYKWLYQTTQGAEHAVDDPIRVREQLEREWLSLGPPLADELLLTPLRPDNAIVRLHLRPYRAAGGDPAQLLDAFLVSAMHCGPDPEAFAIVWDARGYICSSDCRRADARGLGSPRCCSCVTELPCVPPQFGLPRCTSRSTECSPRPRPSI